MSTLSSIDPGSAFPPEPERKPRGCLFYGCLGATVIGVIVLILVGLGAWSGYRAARQFVAQYAEDAPAPIPVVELPAPEIDAIQARTDAFADALAEGKEGVPLVLTAAQVNALLASNVPESKGVVAIEITGEKIVGRVSLPLDKLGFLARNLFPGKYLNGTATIDARVVDGRPFVGISAVEARGKPVPAAVLGPILGQNLIEGLEKDPKVERVIRRLDSIAVKDGTLILTPKPPAKPEPAKPEPAKPEPAEPEPAEPARPEPVKAPG